MLDIKDIRLNTEEYKRRLGTRGVKPEEIDELVAEDKKRRELLVETENLIREANSLGILEEVFLLSGVSLGFSVNCPVTYVTDKVMSKITELRTSKVIAIVSKSISHEYKGTKYLMLDNISDDPNMKVEVREEFIRHIKREMASITFLVQAILKLSRFESNTITFYPKEVSVQKIIDAVISNVSNLSDLKSINAYSFPFPILSPAKYKIFWYSCIISPLNPA